jgi:hypothetical protein
LQGAVCYSPTGKARRPIKLEDLDELIFSR